MCCISRSRRVNKPWLSTQVIAHEYAACVADVSWWQPQVLTALVQLGLYLTRLI